MSFNRATFEDLSVAAFQDELTKIGARAGLKLIRALMAKGTPEAIEQASRLAKTKGVLKPSAVGSQVKHLGRGGEGIADLVAHPDLGVTVRKLYDPTSAIASPGMISRKLQLAKQVKNPMLAETQGFARTGRGGRVSFHEYVPGGAPTDMAERQLKSQLQRAGRAKGFDLQDIRADNIRGGKAIDVLPFHAGETVGMGGVSGNMVMLTPKGMSKWTPHLKRVQGRAPQGVSKQSLYRMLGGGGGKMTPLSQVKAAPTRAPIASPMPKTTTTMPKPTGGVPTAVGGKAPVPTVPARGGGTAVGGAGPSRSQLSRLRNIAGGR